MHNFNNRIAGIAALALFSLMLLAGCGAVTNVGHPTGLDSIIIETDGKITYDFGGDFADERYKTDELVDMAKTQIAEFNAEEGRKAVEFVGSVEENRGGRRVYLEYRFADAESFEKMTGYKLSYTPVEEYASEGFGFSGSSFVSAKDAQLVKSGADLIAGSSGSHIIVTNFPGAVMGGYQIAYYSDNAQLLTAGDTVYATAKTQPEEGEQVFIQVLLRK